MTKTYLLEEAKELVKNGKIQIFNDCPEKSGYLDAMFGKRDCHLTYITDKICSTGIIDDDLEIIPLSAIEDIRWGDEVQVSHHGQDWHDEKYLFCCKSPKNCGYVCVDANGMTWTFNHVRKATAPNFSALIQSTQEAADKIAKGYVVKIEKL